ncbi:MAG: response regulator, partial [Candidatus Omnitrophota bacterium]
LIKLNLEQTGQYRVKTVNKGALALEAAREFRPDLIFLDIIMPDIDGGDVCHQLESDGQIKGTPIVFLTAIAKKEEVAASRGAIGGHPFLAKPVSVRELIDCIERTERI